MPIPGQDKPEKLPPFVGPSERRASPGLPPLPPEKRVGFAVIGLGRLSLEEIIPAFASCKLARLAAVMTGDRAKGQRVTSQYGVPSEAVYSYDDWQALGANPDVQAVYVVTPNGLHLEQVRHAAAIKKHVLCEKPMATSSAEAEQMIEVCRRNDVALMIAYRCQFEPHNREAIRIARSGEFGALKMIEAHNGQVQDIAAQWRHDKRLAGGGALPDIGLYCLNFARFITGEEPVEVMAWAWSTPDDPRFRQIEENIAWQMRFPSGVVARLSAAYDAHEARPARLYFQKAVVKLEPAFAYKGLRLHVSQRSAERADVEIMQEQLLAEPSQFGTEIDHMAECVLTDRRPRTPGEEGLQDQRLMEAIYRSAAEKRPVSLPVITGLDAFRGPALDDED
jgi:predicted dehydrogenase